LFSYYNQKKNEGEQSQTGGASDGSDYAATSQGPSILDFFSGM
jgi:hypothetical protein